MRPRALARAGALAHVVEDPPHRETFPVHRQPAAAGAGEHEQVLGELDEVLAFFDGDLQRLARLVAVVARAQRRLQLGLHDVDRRGRSPGASEACVHTPAFARAKGSAKALRAPPRRLPSISHAGGVLEQFITGQTSAGLGVGGAPGENRPAEQREIRRAQRGHCERGSK
jgi:hypothetical protein